MHEGTHRPTKNYWLLINGSALSKLNDLKNTRSSVCLIDTQKQLMEKKEISSLSG